MPRRLFFLSIGTETNRYLVHLLEKQRTSNKKKLFTDKTIQIGKKTDTQGNGKCLERNNSARQIFSLIKHRAPRLQ